MITFNQDLTQLNFEYLVLARECARHNPLEASWRFGIDIKQIGELAEFSLDKLRELACCSRAVIVLIPMNTPNNISLATHATLAQANPTQFAS